MAATGSRALKHYASRFADSRARSPVTRDCHMMSHEWYTGSLHGGASLRHVGGFPDGNLPEATASRGKAPLPASTPCCWRITEREPMNSVGMMGRGLNRLAVSGRGQWLRPSPARWRAESSSSTTPASRQATFLLAPPYGVSASSIAECVLFLGAVFTGQSILSDGLRVPARVSIQLDCDLTTREHSIHGRIVLLRTLACRARRHSPAQLGGTGRGPETSKSL